MPIFNTVYGGGGTPTKKYKTFTMTYMEASSPTGFAPSYSDDASGLIAGSIAFDEFYNYSAVRLNSAGAVTAEVTQSTPGQLNLSSLGTLTSGDNVMIKFPRLGIKMSKSGSTVTLSITDNPDAEADGFQYYAHSRGTLSNPIKKSAFYMGVYEGSVSNSVLKSLSGATVYTKDNGNATMQDFINFARANDNNDGSAGYDIVGFYQRMYINALYMMKYGNIDSQGTIGQGIVSGSKQASGGSNSIAGATGGNTGNQTSYMKLFGIENWWGNVTEWLGGLCTDGSKNLWTALSGFVGDIKTTSPYENTGTTITTTSGNCLSSIAGNNKALFAPIGTVNNSNYNTYYSDYANVYASRLALAGGSYGSGADAGAFRLDVRYSASGSYATVGSRLMFL